MTIFPPRVYGQRKSIDFHRSQDDNLPTEGYTNTKQLPPHEYWIIRETDFYTPKRKPHNQEEQ